MTNAYTQTAHKQYTIPKLQHHMRHTKQKDEKVLQITKNIPHKSIWSKTLIDWVKRLMKQTFEQRGLERMEGGTLNNARGKRIKHMRSKK